MYPNNSSVNNLNTVNNVTNESVVHISCSNDGETEADNRVVENKIEVIIGNRIRRGKSKIPRRPIRKTIRRSNMKVQALSLPKITFYNIR